MEHRGAVSKHLPKVGAAESTLITAAGFLDQGVQVPLLGPGHPEHEVADGERSGRVVYHKV